MRRRAAAAASAFVLLALPLAARADTAVCSVSFHDWRFEAPGYADAGRLLVVVLPDGSWRASIARDPVTETDLLEEHGEGWTLLGVAGGDVWWGRWRDPVRRLAPGAAALADGVARRLVREQGNPLAAVLTAPMVEEDGGDSAPLPSLSERSAARARGRGARRETWWAVVDAGCIRLRSRRRPVTASAAFAPSHPATADIDDLLVPGWPLGIILETVAD